MCGIAAIFQYSLSGEVIDAPKWLKTANRTHLKRGPDGEGTWISLDGRTGLSHRRLAIIDPTAAGAQPMATEDGMLRIVYNGEIYNYKELKRELQSRGCSFFSNSDTEVILHLYRMEGLGLLNRLRGMYAFALWDERKQGLLLARDPLGIKPLYYSDNGHTIRVASQVKAILSAGSIDISPEPAGHVGFFLWGYVPEPFSLYKGIRSLPPGSSLWLRKNDSTKKTIYFYNFIEELRKAEQRRSQYSQEEAHDCFRLLLEDSVRHHMVSDVPVGIFLSSGLDSTSIAAMAARCSPIPLKTFTLGFEQYRGTQNDESLLAERVAKRLNCIHETHWMHRNEFLAELNKIFQSMDQPSIDGVNTYFVSKAAREIGLKVALSGLGGDELLAGYPSFSQIPTIQRFSAPFAFLGRCFRIVAAPFLRHITSPKYASIIEYGNTFGGAYLLRRGLFMPWELTEILDPDMVIEGMRTLDPIVNLNKAVTSLSSDHLRVSALEIGYYMRNMLLRDTDWASMAHSLEVRVPLVDVKVIESVAPMICGFKGSLKKTMAHASWDDVPRQLLNRHKTGFSFPIREWIKAETKGRGLRGWAQVVYREVKKPLSSCANCYED
ncbi:MAG: asparagine synthase (glutamine-hydrolyzing) [Deltaproteobacteria bacterium]|nr:asparagine synthase (glutamine-hydrolyzing) [Deltaproteobacteria bacterium]